MFYVIPSLWDERSIRALAISILNDLLIIDDDKKLANGKIRLGTTTKKMICHNTIFQ